MNNDQVLKNCRAAEDRHAKCRTEESRREAAINVLHWTQEWLRRHGVALTMYIRCDGYIATGDAGRITYGLRKTRP